MAGPVHNDQHGGEAQAWLLAGAKEIFQKIAASGGMALLGAIGTVLSFTVMLFVLFFVIRDGKVMARAIINLVPLVRVATSCGNASAP